MHRFAAAGAAVCFMSLYRDEVSDIIALDIVLRRNDKDWFEQLPKELEKDIFHKLYCGHFFCHVLHQDYVVKKRTRSPQIEKKMLNILSLRGAKYPAEHKVGQIYEADTPLAKFYKQSEPTNTFNPELGYSSKLKGYGKKLLKS